MIKLIKKSFLILTIGTLGVLISFPIFAQPKCSSVGMYNLGTILSDNDTNWAGIYYGGPSPMNGGGVIAVTAKDRATAENILKYSAPTAKVSGNATKVSNGDGSWFWACSSESGNYTLPKNVTGINFLSPDYDKEGKLAAKQSSVQEKLEKLRYKLGIY